MACPVIVLNNVDGVDNDTTSGAGPSSPIYGTKGRIDTDSPTKLALYETSDPDLGGISVDGSHAARVATASGRQWSKITGKKTSPETITGDATATSDTLTDCDAFEDIAIGDPIRVVGAGPAGADLYSTVKSIPSSDSIQLWKTVSTTAVGTTIRCPEHLVLGNSFAELTSDTSWGIGGKRAALSNSLNLLNDGAGVVGDAEAGWVIEFEETGTDYTVPGTPCYIESGGSSAGGCLTIRGKAAQFPTINCPFAFNLQADLVRFENLFFDEIADSAVILNNDDPRTTVFKDCRFNVNSANDAVRVTSAVTAGRLFLLRCMIKDVYSSHSGKGIYVLGDLDQLVLEGCFFRSISKTAAPTFKGVSIVTDTPVVARGCIFRGGDYGIDLGSSTSAGKAPTIIDGNLFLDEYICLNVGHVQRATGIQITNNLFHLAEGGVFGVSGCAGVAAFIDHNDFSEVDVPYTSFNAGPNDKTFAPDYRTPLDLGTSDVNGDDSPTDYGLGLECRRLGWPSSFLGCSTSQAVDIGAAQRVEGVGGTIAVKILQLVDQGEYLEIQYEVRDGPADGSIQSVEVLEADVPTTEEPHQKKIIGAVEAFLRDGSVTDLIGMEIQA